jgi:cytochrome c
MLLAGCLPIEEPAVVEAGEPRRGQLLLEQYGCGSCPFAHRPYIAGELPNQPELLVQWIRHPRSLVADTTMPDMGMPEQHARDMGAYLMGLR